MIRKLSFVCAAICTLGMISCVFGGVVFAARFPCKDCNVTGYCTSDPTVGWGDCNSGSCPHGWSCSDSTSKEECQQSWNDGLRLLNRA